MPPNFAEGPLRTHRPGGFVPRPTRARFAVLAEDGFVGFHLAFDLISAVVTLGGFVSTFLTQLVGALRWEILSAVRTFRQLRWANLVGVLIEKVLHTFEELVLVADLDLRIRNRGRDVRRFREPCVVLPAFGLGLGVPVCRPRLAIPVGILVFRNHSFDGLSQRFCT